MKKSILQVVLLALVFSITACAPVPKQLPPYVTVVVQPGQFTITSDPGMLVPNATVAYVVRDPEGGSFLVTPEQTPPYRSESARTVNENEQQISVDLVFYENGKEYPDWPAALASANATVPPYPKTEVAKNTSLDDPYLMEEINSAFNLANGSYSITKIRSIPIGRGNNIIDVDITYNGNTVRLYQAQGWCSSGGSGCYAQYCLGAKDSLSYNAVKSHICSQIDNVTYVMRSRPGEKYTDILLDTTDAARQGCNSGAFEKITENGAMFSIRQDSRSCTALKDNETCGPFVSAGSC